MCNLHIGHSDYCNQRLELHILYMYIQHWHKWWGQKQFAVGGWTTFLSVALAIPTSHGVSTAKLEAVGRERTPDSALAYLFILSFDTNISGGDNNTKNFDFGGSNSHSPKRFNQLSDDLFVMQLSATDFSNYADLRGLLWSLRSTFREFQTQECIENECIMQKLKHRLHFLKVRLVVSVVDKYSCVCCRQVQ